MSTRGDVDYLALAHKLGIDGRVVANQQYSRCPLHSDKSPSFSLNLRSGYWTCHTGCGPLTGSSRNFPMLVMLIRGGTHLQALRWIEEGHAKPEISEIRGDIVDLLAATSPDRSQGIRPADDASMAERHYARCSTTVFPEQFIRPVEEGGRGFTWDTVKAWGLRYDERGECVIIPVYDDRGDFRGTVQRLINPRPGEPKYVNTPGMAKNHMLFGLGAQWSGPQIILTEGPLDAIYVRQHGAPAVAIFGSDLSSEQVTLLQRNRIAEVTLMFDADDAGKVGAIKAQNRLLGAGWLLNQIKTVVYPAGRKDANSCTTDELAATLRSKHIFGG